MSAPSQDSALSDAVLRAAAEHMTTAPLPSEQQHKAEPELTEEELDLAMARQDALRTRARRTALTELTVVAVFLLFVLLLLPHTV